MLTVSSSAHPKPIAVPFIADSASPFTFLSNQTFRELGLTEVAGKPSVVVLVNGVKMGVYLSHEHFDAVNDFLYRTEGYAVLDYKSETFAIHAARPCEHQVK